jgi:hypothetical protein
MPSVACQFELFPQANTCHSILDLRYRSVRSAASILDFGLTPP